MKVLTRLVYLLALLVLGLGLYLAFSGRIQDEHAEKAKATAVLPPAASPAGLSATPAQDGPSETTPAKPRPWLADPNRDRESLRRFLARERPDDKEMNAIADQIRVRIRFSELYGLLDLDKTEIARFETAAAQARLTFAELIGSNEKSTEEHKAWQVRTMDKVVSETLGAEYVPVFRAYLETSDLRLIAAELAVNTYYMDTPLTASQAEQFIRVALENRTNVIPGTRVDPATVNWDMVAKRASQFLTPAQLQSLQAMLAKRQFDAEFKDATGLPLRRPLRGI